MAKRSGEKIDWRGNNGWFFPKPGTVKAARCGICGSLMNVKRNVLGPTGWAESMAHQGHLHDSFTCPNLNKDWHEKIVNLKSEARSTACDKIKKILKNLGNP